MGLPDFITEPTVFKEKLTFETALEKTGFGKFNIAVILTSGLGIFAVITELFSIGYVLPSAECDLQLTAMSKGVLSSINIVGLISTSFVCGCVADTKGRKSLIQICLLLAFICSAVSSLMANFWVLVLMRFFSGALIAGPAATILAYCAEFHVVKYRAMSLAFVTFFGGVSMITLPYLAWTFLSWNFELEFLGMKYHSWRMYLGFCSVPCLLVATLLCFLPESPSFLYHSGQEKQVITVLEQMFVYNTGKRNSEFHVEINSFDEEVEKNRGVNLLSLLLPLKYLFRAPHLKYMLLVCGLQFCLFSVSGGLFMWYPDILHTLTNRKEDMTVCQSIEYASTGNSTRCSEIDSLVFKGSIIEGLAYTIACFGWCVVSNIFSNKAILVLFAGVPGLCMIVLNWVTSFTSINVLYILILSLTGVGNGIINALSVDMFPTNICAMAICISLTIGRLGSVISSLFAGVLMEMNCTATLGAYASVLIGSSLLSLLITKRNVD